MKTLTLWLTPIILGVILIALRETGVVTWDWWIVLIPFWVPALLYTAFAIVLVMWYMVTGGGKDKK